MKKHIIDAFEVKKWFPVRHSFFWGSEEYVRAVDGVSLFIGNQETLGIVGESGCGKSTLARLFLGLLKPTSGHVHFMGKRLDSFSEKELKVIRRNIQIVHQDPQASLNPRKTVKHAISQPLRVHRITKRKEQLEEAVLGLLKTVGLSPPKRFIDRFPHQLSGGQRQRVCIARAIAIKPKFIVADEPVSSLDMSIKCQILQLMKELQQKYELSYLIISHDLTMVRSVANRIAVMYLGKIMELADVDDLYNNPLHPYTQTLFRASFIPRSWEGSLFEHKVGFVGEPPNPANPPSGCSFHPRCPNAREKCRVKEAKLEELEEGHKVACHFVEE